MKSSVIPSLLTHITLATVLSACTWISDADYTKELVNVDEDGDLLFNGYASNSSSFLTFFGLKYTFTGSLIWVDADVDSEERSVEEVFKTGSSDFSLAR